MHRIEQWSANTGPRPGAGPRGVRYRAAYFIFSLLYNLIPNSFRTFREIRLLDFYTLGALRLNFVPTLVFSNVGFERCLFKRSCIVVLVFMLCKLG